MALAVSVASSSAPAKGLQSSTPAPAPAVSADPDADEKAGSPTEKTAPELNRDGTMPDAIVKTGESTRVATAWDCLQPNRAPVVWARADHGTVSIKEVTGHACGRPSMSLAGVFYTSKPGYKGRDKLYLLGFLTDGHKIDDTYTIWVK